MTVPDFTCEFIAEAVPEANLFKTICNLVDAEGAVLCYGFSAVTGTENKKPNIGRMLAYARAMHHFFVKYGDKWSEEVTLSYR